MKQESDGWPDRKSLFIHVTFEDYIGNFLDVKTEAEKEEFIEQWLNREGIKLRYERIVKNPGLRALAKLMLNSFWGKFGQRSHMTRTEYFTEPAEYFDLVFDQRISVKNVRVVNENLVAVTYVQEEDFVDVLTNTNPVIAAYTTAQARLKLYSYITQLNERCLYFDTGMPFLDFLNIT